MLAIGLGTFAFSMYLTAGLTNQAGFVELFVPQAVRGFALMFCYLPANLIALSTVPQDKLKNAAGLYNLTRDLGGAIVLATIGTIMNDRLHFHWNRLIENINPARPAVQQFLDAQTNRFDSLVPGDPQPRRSQAARQSGATRGPGPDLQRRLDAAGRRVRRRGHADPAGAPPALADGELRRAVSRQ